MTTKHTQLHTRIDPTLADAIKEQIALGKKYTYNLPATMQAFVEKALWEYLEINRQQIALAERDRKARHTLAGYAGVEVPDKAQYTKQLLGTK